MIFDWDQGKNQLNKTKHHIDFATAARVFSDENRLELYDDIHSTNEDRYITIGSVNGIITVLVVVYTERFDMIRIISARKANDKERKLYYARKED